MTLYKIDKQMLNCVDTETGEIIDVDKLQELQMAFDTKVENIGCWIKELSAEAKAIKEEKDKLAARQKVSENKAESLKKYLADILAGQKFKTAKVSISYRKSEAVEVTDAALLDDDYFKYSEPTVDKIKVKQALKEGIDLKGVQLVEKENIQIK